MCSEAPMVGRGEQRPAFLRRGSFRPLEDRYPMNVLQLSSWRIPGRYAQTEDRTAGRQATIA